MKTQTGDIGMDRYLFFVSDHFEDFSIKSWICIKLSPVFWCYLWECRFNSLMSKTLASFPSPPPPPFCRDCQLVQIWQIKKTVTNINSSALVSEGTNRHQTINKSDQIKLDVLRSPAKVSKMKLQRPERGKRVSIITQFPFLWRCKAYTSCPSQTAYIPHKFIRAIIRTV